MTTPIDPDHGRRRTLLAGACGVVAATRAGAVRAGAAGASAGDAAGAAGAAGAGADDGGSAPAIAGEVRFDDASRAAAASDFGHLIRRTPACVVRPLSARDVAATLRWAMRRGLPVAPQGRRHSVFGRPLVEAGVALDLSSLRMIHAVHDDRMIVDAGATWHDVLAATLPRRRMPPVLPDYLGLSVGGTLAVGGVGGTISYHGLVTDNVVELEGVAGNGEPLRCSAETDPVLFDALRAGLGQAAVITRATLRLVPAPAQVRRFQLVYPDLATLLRDQRLLAADARFDAVQGAVVATPAGWSFRIDAAKAIDGRALDAPPLDDGALLAGLADDRRQAKVATLPLHDYLGRLDALERALRDNGQWSLPHPWLTTFVGDTQVEPLAAGALAELTPADLGPFGQVVLSVFRRQAVGTPLLRLPSDPLCYAFNLIRVPTAADAQQAARLVGANRVLYERVRDGGGTLYPVAALPMSVHDWRGHFGEAYARLGEAKRRHDPGGLLVPGYELF
ncbi:MAG: FAD-binding protein [Lautropia sp.]